MTSQWQRESETETDQHGGCGCGQKSSSRAPEAFDEASASPGRLFDRIVYGGESLSELSFGENQDDTWDTIAMPRSPTAPQGFRDGDLVVQRALGEGKLACLRVLGTDVETRMLYGPDGLIRRDMLVLRRRSSAGARRRSSTEPRLEPHAYETYLEAGDPPRIGSAQAEAIPRSAAPHILEFRGTTTLASDPLAFRTSLHDKAVEILQKLNNLGIKDEPRGRCDAYVDAIAWNESADLRRGLRSCPTPDGQCIASSCGLVVRSLWRLLGARDVFFDDKGRIKLLDPPYKNGSVMANLRRFAELCGALKPINSRADFDRADPQKGDVIFINKGRSQHVFTIVERSGNQFISIDGGQGGDGDGNCCGIRQRTRTLPSGALIFTEDTPQRPITAVVKLSGLRFTAPIIDIERGARAPAASAPAARASAESAEDGELPFFLRWAPDWRAGIFPPRDKNAKGGLEFMQKLGGGEKLDPNAWVKREDAIIAELLAGNMPDALLRWVNIEVSYKDLKGTVQVLPDYLAVGHDGDFVHVPLDPVSAQRVADTFGAMLPTARICHAIYKQTPNDAHRIGLINRDYYLPPNRRTIMRNDWAQDSTAAYLEHSQRIQDKMRAAGIRPGELIAGHKKDVVIAKRLHENPDRIAFQGFYNSNGYPMEPCYEPDNRLHKEVPPDIPTLAHSRRFSDYSQGVRLVHPMMKIDGQTRSIEGVLADPQLSYLISSEGPIVPPSIPKLNKSKPTKR